MWVFRFILSRKIFEILHNTNIVISQNYISQKVRLITTSFYVEFKNKEHIHIYIYIWCVCLHTRKHTKK